MKSVYLPYKGYCLRESIAMPITIKLGSITVLYQKLQKYRTFFWVELAIRHAIEVPGVVTSMRLARYSATQWSSEIKPTNAEFIAMIADVFA